jgi:serine/threonine protein kinase
MAGESTAIVGGRLGPFAVEAVLGEGGMGIVYRAVRVPSGETVALKVLKQVLSSDEVYRRRFEREAYVAREVRHRHLVPVLESGQDRGVQYLAMAYSRATRWRSGLPRGRFRSPRS